MGARAPLGARPSGAHGAVLGGVLVLSWVAVLGIPAPLTAQLPFSEEAAARGLSIVPTPASPYGAGVALADFDGDVDLDLLVTAIGSTGEVRVFANDGSGVYSPSPHGSLAANLHLTGVSVADFDGDGDLDPYITGWGVPNRLFRNDGGFAFTDVSVAAGVADGGLGTSSSWGDYDGDGWLDLYVCNYSGTPWGGSVNAIPNRLYRNLGDGTFAEVGGAQGVDDPFKSFQSVFFDADLDGDLDLYVANDRGSAITGARNRLFRNDGGSFTDVSAASGAGLFMDGMGVDSGDFDRDGDFDLYVTNTVLGHALLVNDGSGNFVEDAVAAGVPANLVGWGCSFLDFDHDAWEDLYVLHELAPNHLYRHAGTFPAVECAVAMGVEGGGAAPGSLGFHYCHAQGDIDGDGDLDLLVQRFNAPLLLYINQAGAAKRWLGVRLAEPGPNRFAIGAVVQVHAGAVTQRKQSKAGLGFRSSSDHRLEFGLDLAMIADQVLVRWPDGELSQLLAVASDQDLVVDRAVVGTLADCDRDFIPDADEIALDPTLDQDGDGWLDSCPHRFMRSDANLDAAVDIGDPITVLGGLFLAGELLCEDAADANDDGQIDIADAITVLGHLFGGSGGLPPACRADPTQDPLGCETATPGC